MPNTAMSSDIDIGIPSMSIDVSSDADDIHISVPPAVSSNTENVLIDLTSIVPDASEDVTSTAHITHASIGDNGPGLVYTIAGVVIAIIVLGTIIALVAVVLFMKAR